MLPRLWLLPLFVKARVSLELLGVRLLGVDRPVDRDSLSRALSSSADKTSTYQEIQGK